MNETHLTIRGRLTNDPELRFTPSGAAVANFTIASNARTFDRLANEWKDADATFWRCAAWRDMAENVAESLTRGIAVVAVGVVKSRDYETKDGEKRTSLEVEIEGIGPDLRWQTAKASKAQRAQVGGGSVSASHDPWTQQTQQPAQAQQSGGWDESPF